MSDAVVSNASCDNGSNSSSQDEHDHLHHDPESPRPPEYSEQPIDSRDTAAQRAMPSSPPPRYDNPPPYTVDYRTPVRSGVGEVRIHGVPDISVAAARRQYLSTRPSASSNSSWKYVILACVVFWMCGFIMGAAAFVLAVMARRKSPSTAPRLNFISASVSVAGIVVGGFLILLLTLLIYNPRSDHRHVKSGRNRTTFGPEPTTTTASPEVTSSACYEVVNETSCFRFAYDYTATYCSEVGGVIVSVNTSSFDAAPISTMCFHKQHSTCYSVRTLCFQHRTARLDRDTCRGLDGYYVVEPSGRSCYYNKCPGHTASDNKCYRDVELTTAANCYTKHGFYENGYCYYNH